MLYKDFAKIIKESRIEANLTQYEMALNLGLSRSSYNKIENGNMEPSFHTLVAISRYFSFDLNDLFEIKKPRKEYYHLFD